MTLLHTLPARYVLPPEVYDALAVTAEAFGGIGANGMYADVDRQIPVCAHGLLEFARGRSDWQPQADLLALGITPAVNDAAILAMPRGSKTYGPFGRITFQTWCRRLRVVRGVE